MNERRAAGGVSDNAAPGDSRSEDNSSSATNENGYRKKSTTDDNTDSPDETVATNSVPQADKNGNCTNVAESKPLESTIGLGDTASSYQSKDLQTFSISECLHGGGDTAEHLIFPFNDGPDHQDKELNVIRESAPSQCLNWCALASGDSEKASLRSILKKDSGTSSPKTVTFSETLNCLIDNQFKNVCISFHWNGVNQHTVDEIIREYHSACLKAQAIPIDGIIEQLQDIQNNTNYSATLNLTSVKITGDVINMLEIIFQMVNFHTIYINIEQFESDTSQDILNMIDYYDPVVELVISGHKEDLHMWQGFADVAANSSNSLSNLSFREVVIEDQALRIIFDGINSNPHIKIVRFDGCELNRAPTFMLANHLKNNYFIEELHLCFADLYFKEADILGKFLAVNTSLKVLNLSNNKIGDRGFDALTKGLLEQSHRGAGVVVLMLANNRLTKKCADTLNTVISNCPLLHSINVGLNNLTDAVIFEIQDALASSTALKSFGLQAILLTCSGLQALAKACQLNTSLRHLNLRGNKAVQPEALNDFGDVIHRTTLVQIDFDDTSRYSSNSQQYVEVINKIKHMVAVNRIVWEDKDLDQYQSWGREFSLNCEPEFVPQARCRTRSRAPASTATRSRFQVITVPESTVATPLSPTHRFTVVTVASASSSAATSASTSEDVNVGPESTQKCGSSGTENVPTSIFPYMEKANNEAENLPVQEIALAEEQTCASVDPQSIISADSDVVVGTVSSDSTVTSFERQKDVESFEADLDNILEKTRSAVAHNRDDCADGDSLKTIED